MLFRFLEGFRVGYVLANLVKVTAASLVMAILVYCAHQWAVVRLAGGLVMQLLALLGLILLGALVYLFLVALLKIPEFTELRADLRARWRGRKP